MEWQDGAKDLLSRVPKGVLKMVTLAVEEAAEKAGLSEVTPEFVAEYKQKLGYGDTEKKKNKKIAVVRCHQVAEVCPGVGCLRAWNDKRVHFSSYSQEDELIGFFTCGGCNGRRVSRMVGKLKDNYDLDVLHLSGCMMMDKEDYPRCPFKETFKKAARAKGVEVVEGTHH